MNREKEIINEIIKLIEHIERFSNYTGKEKREYVLRNMKEYLGEAQYIQAKLFLGIIIDFVVATSKGFSVDINNEHVRRCCGWMIV